MNFNNKEYFFELAKVRRGMIYFAADELYFQQHGIFLLRSSIHHNHDWFVHVHIYNPSQTTILTLSNLKNVTFSTEITNNHLFNKEVDEIKKNPEKARRICKTIKSHDRERFCGVLSHLLVRYPFLSSLAPRRALINYLIKTYYSCQRFVILDELLRTGAVKGDVIALDADAIFNKALPTEMPHAGCDVAIKYRESNSGQNFLAGSILFPAQGRRNAFLKNFADELKLTFSKLELEWGLDQILLNKIVPKFHWESLSQTLGDLDFSNESIIWLAKGKSKAEMRYASAQNNFKDSLNSPS